MKDITIHVISHTHWDREWYRTNQEFRVELVSVVDAVLEELQRQEGFFCFTLDGQAILLEDYLQMRPEQTEIVRTLVRGGNLLVGPWYTQPDEFLVSGEALVRNLQTGIQTAALYGGSMRVGWVPDAFGHASQLPQIFRHFEIDCAALTRGIGNELPEMETDFHWRSPDGSRVFVAHQVQGYYSGGLLGFPYFWGSVSSHMPSVEIARTRLLRLVEPGGRKPQSRHVALWNGADHLHPEPDLAQTLVRLEENMPGYRIVHSSVAEYVRGVRGEGRELPVITGELRGSRYHPLLPSILSSRIPLKQRNAAVQRLLERHSEPIATIGALLAPFTAPNGPSARFYYPGHALRESWKLLLQNHGHDSIGGCSIDQVHREMHPRFDQAEQIARAICSIGIARAARSISTDWAPESVPALVVFSPHDRPGVRIVTHSFVWSDNLAERAGVVGSDGAALPSQVVQAREDRYQWLQQETTARDVAENAWWWSEVLRRMDRMALRRFEVSTEGEAKSLALFLADESACREETVVSLVETFRQLAPGTRVRIEARFYRHEIIFAAPLPALGMSSFAIHDGRDPLSEAEWASPVTAAGRELAFGGNRLLVEPDGSLTVHTSFGQEHRSVVRLVDEGDRGDSYDFSPTSEGALALAPAGEARVDVAEEGPVRASLDVSFTALVPSGLADDRRSRSRDLVELPVRYRVSVCMASERVVVNGTLDNRARDHRVRVLFDAGIQATHIVADGQFSVEERPISPPDTTGWAQSITSIRPHQSWVSLADHDRGICIHTDGLHEHEAVPSSRDAASAIGVTLLRSFGWLSRGDLDTRRGQAGPMIETPDAQEIGLNRFRFSFQLVPGAEAMSWTECTSEPAFLESITTPAMRGQQGLADRVSLLNLKGTPFALTAVKGSIRVPGAVVVRFFNTSRESVSERVRVSYLFDRATRVRLDESPIEDEELEDGAMTVAARAAEIVTIRLEPAPRHRVARDWERGGRGN